MTTKIGVAKSLGKHLQGKVLARKHFAQTCELLAGAATEELVLLDFAGVEIVTGSWVNAMVVPLFDWAADARHDIYPVFLNLQDRWADDLQLVAEWNRHCYLWGSGRDESPKKAKLIGSLDSVLEKTLEGVLRFGAVTGAGLDREYGDEGVGPTAWNNRLRDLHTKRLLRRAKRGREQVYSPVVEEIVFDGR